MQVLSRFTLFFLLVNFVCVHRSHQPLSGKHRKPRGVGLEAKEVLTGGMGCEGKFCKFTIAFGHLNLDKQTHKTLFSCRFITKLLWLAIFAC